MVDAICHWSAGAGVVALGICQACQLGLLQKSYALRFAAGRKFPYLRSFVECSLHPRAVAAWRDEHARRVAQVGSVCMACLPCANTIYPLRYILRVARFNGRLYDLRLVLVRVRAVKAKRAHQLSLAQASSRDISSLVREGLLRDCHNRNVFVIVAAIP